MSQIMGKFLLFYYVFMQVPREIYFVKKLSKNSWLKDVLKLFSQTILLILEGLYFKLY